MVENNNATVLDYLPHDVAGLTEERIERHAERAMDAVDRLFMGNRLTQSEYDANVRRLDRWTMDANARSRAA